MPILQDQYLTNQKFTSKRFDWVTPKPFDRKRPAISDWFFWSIPVQIFLYPNKNFKIKFDMEQTIVAGFSIKV